MWITDGRAKPLMDRKVIDVPSLSLLSVSFSDYLPTYPPIYLCIHLSISLSLCLSVCLSIYLSTYLPIYLSTYLPIYLSIYLSAYLSISLSVCLSTCLSASLKTKLFCETSSMFELDNVVQALCMPTLVPFLFGEPSQVSSGSRSKLPRLAPRQSGAEPMGRPNADCHWPSQRAARRPYHGPEVHRGER